jgi:hypothetical protein
MVSRREKLVKRLLSSLNVEKNPQGKPGNFERTKKKWASKKDRRASGWVTPKLVHPQMKYKDIVQEALEPQAFYDSWASWKDGMNHNTAPDQLYHKWKGCCRSKEEVYAQNNKLRKMARIRKAKLGKKKLLQEQQESIDVVTE